MRIIFCLMVFLFIGKNTMLAQQLSSFVEYGAALHTGDNTPLWQVSNQQGLTSLDNNTYIRGGISYKHQLGKWKFEEALDLVAAAGFSTTSFIVQQAYVDIRYKWFGFFAGSREQNSPLLNQELSSGGMTWSGNARPIPQVQIGIPEYVQLLPRLGLKGEISYGWFTDNKYQREQVGEKYWYTKSIKYHHKEGFLRIGIPKGKWQLELGMTLDTQFGGYKIGGSESGDLGNGWKDYVRVFFPGHGREDGPVGEHLAFQGNFLGSEYIKMTYRPKEDFSISAYLDNHFDDFSAMAKLNGWDGLWGVEYKSNHRQAINEIVIEYLQTTNMSGPLRLAESDQNLVGSNQQRPLHQHTVGRKHADQLFARSRADLFFQVERLVTQTAGIEKSIDRKAAAIDPLFELRFGGILLHDIAHFDFDPALLQPFKGFLTSAATGIANKQGFHFHRI